MDYLSKKIIDDYHQLSKEKTKKISNVFGMIAIACLVLAIIAFIIYDFDDLLFLLISAIFAGLFFIMVVVWVIMIKVFISEKPLYQFLYPKLVEDIQYNEQYAMRYEAYPKIKEILRESKIFTKYASSITRAGFYYTDESSHSISVYDTYYYTQTNNAVVIHLNGYYIVVDNIDASAIQIRTKGRPSRSDVSLIKTINENRFKVFCEDIHAPSNEKIINIFHLFHKRIQPKHLYVSVMSSKLYIAIDLHKPKRKIKSLDQSSYADLKNNLMHLLDTITESLE